MRNIFSQVQKQLPPGRRALAFTLAAMLLTAALGWILLRPALAASETAAAPLEAQASGSAGTVLGIAMLMLVGGLIILAIGVITLARGVPRRRLRDLVQVETKSISSAPMDIYGSNGVREALTNRRR
jgi:hypothetical protein